jgi:peptidyl-prolyl cis-trans isomerase C
MNSKIILVLVVAALVAVGAVGYFGLNGSSAPEPENINEVVENSSDTMEMEVTETSDGTIVAGSQEEVEETVEQVEAQTPQINEGEMIIKEGNPVVAKVDGAEVTRNEVYRFIQSMPANMQQMPAVTVYPVAVDQVINTRLVQNKAEEANITETEIFKKEMEIARQQIARNLYLQQEVDKEITESKVKKAYNEFIKKVPDVEERRARHILLETEAKAKAVIDRLNAGGDFAEVAAELSTGPTASKGGDLGYFAKTEMVPEFANAAFGLGEGEMTEVPVKTQFGWHVIKVEEIRQRPKPSMDQLEPSIRAELRRSILDELVQEWRKDAKIVQFDINGEPLKEGANATGLVPPKVEPAAE